MVGTGHRDQHHQRQQGQRRIPCHGPGQASRKPAERETRSGEEGQGDIALQEVTHAPIDLVQAAEPPPDHPPAQQQIRQPALRRVQRLPRPLQQPRAEQARDRQQQRAQAHAVYHRPVAGRRPQVGHKENSGKQLQQDAEQSHRQALLPHTDPDHRRALECPRCRRPATVKGERDGQRREHRAECKKGFHQQAPVLAPARPHAAGEQQVKGAERERAVRRAVRDFRTSPTCRPKATSGTPKTSVVSRWRSTDPAARREKRTAMATYIRKNRTRNGCVDAYTSGR
jgi:hypothetical protein